MASPVIKEEWGDRRVELTQAFSQLATQPRLPELPGAETTRDYYLSIDSGSRDTQSYSNRASFRYTLSETLNNILSIEVLTLAVPCINNLIDESYILLDLGSQLNTWEAGPNRTRAFQVFYPAPRVNWWPSKPEPPNIDSNVPLGLIVYDKKSAERSPTIFYPSKPRINDLFLTLRDRFGQPLDIGSDSNSADLISNKDCQWSVTLKITCSVPPNLTSQRFGN